MRWEWSGEVVGSVNSASGSGGKARKGSTEGEGDRGGARPPGPLQNKRGSRGDGGGVSVFDGG